MAMKKSPDKILGALLGVAVGDALGAPLEFMSAEEIRAKHGTVREMIGGGWLNVMPGEITDDTQMTLSVAEGIVENPQDPIPGIGRRFVEWYDSRPKDIGVTCRSAIAYAKANGAQDENGWHEAARRVHADTNGMTAGNGALMRTIYPALWYGRKSARIAAAAIGRMTHWHDDSTLSVIAYTEAVADIIGADKIPDAGIGWSKERIEYRMRRVRELAPDNERPRPDGYVLNSLVCAINAIRDTSSFEGALIQAVNLGGDADTIGAITGGLAGALYGARTIPQRWTDALDKDTRNRLERCADKACKSEY
ncbi:MAG: ADP-ribosylglycohydrolase family protein [Acidaminococcales bacterium]|jgi:ADP-ribosyl-[dinitrogen reductase] hydrolase|nr:ADP-ribosylglycohydrolase family protein [Acidaminococcales bacterium]